MNFIQHLLLMMISTGGCGFLEHPEWPHWLDPAQVASIWGSRAIQLMSTIKAVTVTSMDQCVFGSSAKKPTTILTVRLDQFRRTVMMSGWGGRCNHPRGFHTALKGRTQDGTFRTAEHKVYPPGLNIALADAIGTFADGLAALGSNRNELPSVFTPFLEQAFASSDIVQPDFHRDVAR